MGLLDDLQKGDKKELFNRSQTLVGYSTGFPLLDHRNGRYVKVQNKDKTTNEKYPITGLINGSLNIVAGLNGVAKTTFCVQAAYHIVSNIDDAIVIHYDLEQVLNYGRISDITGVNDYDLLEKKYIIRQDRSQMEDIIDTINAIAEAKEKGNYKYNTGVLNEFGEEIELYKPTIIIIDSLPTLTSRSLRDLNNNKLTGDEIMSAHVDKMKTAGHMKSFLVTVLPKLKTYNITILAINHVTDAIQINTFNKKQKTYMYMKGDKEMPGGTALSYFANNVYQFVKTDTYTEEKNGFDGFSVRIYQAKSRTNKAGQFIDLVYDQEKGFDNLRSMVKCLDDRGLLLGRNPYKYVAGNEPIKFSTKDIHKEVEENPGIIEIIMEAMKPILTEMIVDIPDGDLKKASDIAMIIDDMYKKVFNEISTEKE